MICLHKNIPVYFLGQVVKYYSLGGALGSVIFWEHKRHFARKDLIPAVSIRLCKRSIKSHPLLTP